MRTELPGNLQILSKRFWSKVDKTDGCWNWIAATDGKQGYGRFGIRIKGHTIAWSAPRISWVLANGVIPKLGVLHRCDNPCCVRPDHLFLGTQKDNMRDCANKGRINLESAWAVNRNKTHCKYRHPYNSKNTYIYRTQRHCRECHRIFSREHYRKMSIKPKD